MRNIFSFFFSFQSFLTSASESFLTYTVYDDGFSAMKQHLKITECTETGGFEHMKELHLKRFQRTNPHKTQMITCELLD